MKRLTMPEIFSRLQLNGSQEAMNQLVKNIAKNQLVDRKTKHDVLIRLAGLIMHYAYVYHFDERATVMRAIQLVQEIAKMQKGVR